MNKQRKEMIKDLRANRESLHPQDLKNLELIEKFMKAKTVKVEAKVGRNDPCPCGSGKKHKKCCL